MEEIFGIISTECGVVSTTLLLVIAGLVFIGRALWRRIQEIEDILIDIIADNTEVITRLVDRIDDNEHQRYD